MIFHPLTGNVKRTFDRLWQVVQYELGVSRRDIGLMPSPDAGYEQRTGWIDRDSQRRKTFDEMLDEVSQ